MLDELRVWSTVLGRPAGTRLASSALQMMMSLAEESMDERVERTEDTWRMESSE